MTATDKLWFGSKPIPPEWGKGLTPCRMAHGARYLYCEGWVYLVGPLPYSMTGLFPDENLQLIRLGFTTDLYSRIKTHAEYIHSRPDPLLVAIPGSRADERFFHKLFAEFRYKGSMYWGNECLRASAVEAVASYEGDMGEYLYGARRVYPSDWVEEQMLWIATRFKKYADRKGPVAGFDVEAPMEICMGTLLRQMAVYAHVNLPGLVEPREDYVSTCADREFLSQIQAMKRLPPIVPV